MFSNLVREMNQALGIRRSNNFNTKEQLPAWLS